MSADHCMSGGVWQYLIFIHNKLRAYFFKFNTMAKILFTGRLTADAELRNKETGFATFTLAENVGFGEKKKTNYFDCKGNFTEGQLKYLTKGKSLDIIGELEIEVNQVGEKKYYNTKVTIIHFEFTPLSPKKEDEDK